MVNRAGKTLVNCLIFLLVFIAACDGCKEKKSMEDIIPVMPENDLKQWNLKGSIRKIIEKNYNLSENGGNEKDEIFDNKAEYTFNKQGLIEKSIFYNKSGNIISENSFKYNDRGYKSEWQNITGGRTKIIRYSHEFDDKGQLIRTLVYGDVIEYGEEYTYDNSGNMISNRRLNNAGLTESYKEFVFDIDGRIIKTLDIDKSGKETASHLQEYDKSGNVSVYKWYEGEKLKLEYNYEYDKHGNRIKVCKSDAGREKTCNYSEYTYDIEGNWTRLLIHNELQGTLVTVREIEYY